MLGLLIATATSEGQSIWTNRNLSISQREKTDIAVEFEYLHPTFTSASGSLSGEIWTFASRIHVGPENDLIVEIPFVNVGGNEGAIGSPYIGMEIIPPGSPFFGEVGLRVPIMSKNSATAAFVGILADFDRFEAYVPNLLQVGGAFNFHPVTPSGFGGRIRLGPQVDLATQSGSNSNLYVAYCALITYDSDLIESGAGWVGRALLSSDATDRSVDQLEGCVRFKFDNIRPAFQIRYPLDVGLSNSLSFTYALNLAMLFNY